MVQHALSLFRTQRIVKIFLEVDTQANKLIANIWAENGAALPLSPANSPTQNLDVGQTLGRFWKELYLWQAEHSPGVCRSGETIYYTLHEL